MDRAPDLAASPPSTRRDTPDSATHNDVELDVLGRFDLRLSGRAVSLGRSCQRLLVLLAVRGGKVNRANAAGNLWPEVPSARAIANLRSVLWRLQRCCDGAVQRSLYDLQLAPETRVDICEALSVTRKLLDRSSAIDSETLRRARECNLYDDIVPDLGDEEWLQVERERFLQLRVHSLEVLAEHFLVEGWYGAAIENALGVIQSDPFRECAYHLLIRAHLLQGSYLEARRHFQAYCQLLHSELGLKPSAKFMSLLEDVDRPQYGKLAATR